MEDARVRRLQAAQQHRFEHLAAVMDELRQMQFVERLTQVVASAARMISPVPSFTLGDWWPRVGMVTM